MIDVTKDEGKIIEQFISPKKAITTKAILCDVVRCGDVLRMLTNIRQAYDLKKITDDVYEFGKECERAKIDGAIEAIDAAICCLHSQVNNIELVETTITENGDVTVERSQYI